MDSTSPTRLVALGVEFGHCPRTPTRSPRGRNSSPPPSEHSSRSRSIRNLMANTLRRKVQGSHREENENASSATVRRRQSIIGLFPSASLLARRHSIKDDSIKEETAARPNSASPKKEIKEGATPRCQRRKSLGDILGSITNRTSPKRGLLLPHAHEIGQGPCHSAYADIIENYHKRESSSIIGIRSVSPSVPIPLSLSLKIAPAQSTIDSLAAYCIDLVEDFKERQSRDLLSPRRCSNSSAGSWASHVQTLASQGGNRTPSEMDESRKGTPDSYLQLLIESLSPVADSPMPRDDYQDKSPSLSPLKHKPLLPRDFLEDCSNELHLLEGSMLEQKIPIISICEADSCSERSLEIAENLSGLHCAILQSPPASECERISPHGDTLPKPTPTLHLAHNDQLQVKIDMKTAEENECISSVSSCDLDPEFRKRSGDREERYQLLLTGNINSVVARMTANYHSAEKVEEPAWAMAFEPQGFTTKDEMESCLAGRRTTANPYTIISIDQQEGRSLSNHPACSANVLELTGSSSHGKQREAIPESKVRTAIRVEFPATVRQKGHFRTYESMEKAIAAIFEYEYCELSPYAIFDLNANIIHARLPEWGNFIEPKLLESTGHEFIWLPQYRQPISIFSQNCRVEEDHRLAHIEDAPVSPPPSPFSLEICLAKIRAAHEPEMAQESKSGTIPTHIEPSGVVNDDAGSIFDTDFFLESDSQVAQSYLGSDSSAKTRPSSPVLVSRLANISRPSSDDCSLYMGEQGQEPAIVPTWPELARVHQQKRQERDPGGRQGDLLMLDDMGTIARSYKREEIPQAASKIAIEQKQGLDRNLRFRLCPKTEKFVEISPVGRAGYGRCNGCGAEVLFLGRPSERSVSNHYMSNIKLERAPDDSLQEHEREDGTGFADDEISILSIHAPSHPEHLQEQSVLDSDFNLLEKLLIRTVSDTWSGDVDLTDTLISSGIDDDHNIYIPSLPAFKYGQWDLVSSNHLDDDQALSSRSSTVPETIQSGLGLSKDRSEPVNTDASGQTDPVPTQCVSPSRAFTTEYLLEALPASEQEVDSARTIPTLTKSCALIGLLEARGSLSGRYRLPVPSLPKTFQATKARKPFAKFEMSDIDADDSDKENQAQSLRLVQKVSWHD